MVIYFTYAYQFALMVVVVILTIMGVVVAKRENRQPISLHVIFDESGIFSFEEPPKNKGESTRVEKKQFQLLSSSRYSFFGCWLHIEPLSNTYFSPRLPDGMNKIFNRKWLFIYRDSLTAEEFSRLSQIIRKIKSTA
jgi:hypothetical protein